MTHGTGAASDHLELDTLADLDEGLLSAEDLAAAEAHLAGCRPCREQQARIRSTRALLAALPAEPMPPDVAGRVHDVLSRTSSSTVLPLAGDLGARRSRWRSRPTLAGLAAVAAGLALVAAIVVGGTDDSSQPDAPSTVAGPTSDQALGAAPAYPMTISGRHYTAGNAQRLVTRLARSATQGSASGVGSGAGGSVESQRAKPALDPTLRPLYTSRDALLTCVAALTVGHPTLPLAVDFATFSDKTQRLHNAPALVVALPGPPGHADVWIVGPACATAADNDFYSFKRVPLG